MSREQSADQHYPIVIAEDRYQGTYSGGAWLAISGSDRNHSGLTRIGFVLSNEAVGPHSDDVSAMRFWSKPPEWIAVGTTPQEALENLVNGVKPRAQSLRGAP